MKKVTSILLLLVVILSLDGCYSPFRLRMDEVYAEIQDDERYDEKIENVVLMDGTKVVFDRRGGKYIVDENIVKGNDVNNTERVVQGEQILYITVQEIDRNKSIWGSIIWAFGAGSILAIILSS
jgi:hypothetical protein